MSYHCQFCDKKMVMEMSVVYQNEFITCGAEKCTDEAFANAKFHHDDAHHKEMDILVFESKTPEDATSWRVVKEEDYPASIHDYDIVSKMLEGFSIYDEPGVHYIAMKTKDYQKLLHKENKRVKKNGTTTK